MKTKSSLFFTFLTACLWLLINNVFAGDISLPTIGNDAKTLKLVEQIYDYFHKGYFVDEATVLLNQQKENFAETQALEEHANAILRLQEFSDKQTEKLPQKKSYFRNNKNDRTFLLKFAIPVSITAALFYALYCYYKTTPFSITTSFSSSWGEKWNMLWGKWSSYLLRQSETISAICLLLAAAIPANSLPINNLVGKIEKFMPSAVTKVINGIVQQERDGILSFLRIVTSLLFLTNKDQYSVNAVLYEGAYYRIAWLIYDVCHCLGIIPSFHSIEEDNLFSEEKVTLLDKIDYKLCNNVLPLTESITTLFLSLNSDNTDIAKKARKQLLSIYSLSRFVPVYLKNKNNAIDTLLAIHALVTFLEFFEIVNKNKSGDGNCGNSSSNVYLNQNDTLYVQSQEEQPNLSNDDQSQSSTSESSKPHDDTAISASGLKACYEPMINRTLLERLRESNRRTEHLRASYKEHSASS